MAPLVQVETLTKQFGNVRAIDGLSFEVNEGEYVAIMGPSGSGKTTLINILGGLDRPTSGMARVDGIEIGELGEEQMTRYRAEKIGFIFQQYHLVPYLTAVENVMLAQYFHSMTDETGAAEALKRVGLGDRLRHLPSQLSGGEQQRVAIARALINQPKLILADEPTGNVDEANEKIILELFAELHAAGHTILIVTHDPAIGRMTDRRIELEHGRLAQITTFSQEDEAHFDHMLEQIWVRDEEGADANAESPREAQVAAAEPERLLARLTDLHLVVTNGGAARLTDLGRQRARDVIRRHRLAERLLMDTFSVADPEAHSDACKFEHIISPELDQKICTFLNHPRTCPHGSPIPRGDCCPPR